VTLGHGISSSKGHHSLVSVVIPTRDRHAFLAQALASVAAQTYPKIEVIVIDDGSRIPVSRDLLRASLKTGEAGGIIPATLIRLARPKGAAAARNAGVRKARGGLVAFLDDDDLFEPGKIALQVEYMESHPEVAAVSCAHVLARADGEHLVYRGSPAFGRRDAEWMVFPRSFSLVLARRSALEDMVLAGAEGPLDEDFPSAEDWDFWLRSAGRFKLHSIPQVLCTLRAHDGSRLSDPDLERRGLEMLLARHRASLGKAARRYVAAHVRMLQAASSGRQPQVLRRLRVVRSLATASPLANVVLVIEQATRLAGKFTADPGLPERTMARLLRLGGLLQAGEDLLP